MSATWQAILAAYAMIALAVLYGLLGEKPDFHNVKNRHDKFKALSGHLMKSFLSAVFWLPKGLFDLLGGITLFITNREKPDPVPETQESWEAGTDDRWKDRAKSK
jgi:hypothetical protein